ncbi:hypothetical protein BDU57DRAFT_533780 [Ampelomyces quisqualis]|uniref:Uncharacterized protein n=1 Tax=Ampelomyces quisqualis TaxID=50730 RepID=A0A6A5Q4G8_AMPQU|nr:hypothetical protein BDU57DRAFT_533780 [Ampelomyces quisqualis]
MKRLDRISMCTEQGVPLKILDTYVRALHSKLWTETPPHHIPGLESQAQASWHYRASPCFCASGIRQVVLSQTSRHYQEDANVEPTPSSTLMRFAWKACEAIGRVLCRSGLVVDRRALTLVEGATPETVMPSMHRQTVMYRSRRVKSSKIDLEHQLRWLRLCALVSAILSIARSYNLEGFEVGKVEHVGFPPPTSECGDKERRRE